MSKLRVLCLHGYRQNGSKLRGRIAAYRRTFKSSTEFVFVDAPIVVPYEPTSANHKDQMQQKQQKQQRDEENELFDAATSENEEVQQFSWWNYHIDAETGDHRYSNVMETIDYIATLWHEQGPFDGVLGFSQGGMLASMLLQLQHTRPSEYPFAFAFGIFIAASASRDPQYLFHSEQLQLPTLHMMGEMDAVVSIERSRKLAELFVSPSVFVHTGGHYIPANKEPKDAMRAFIKSLASNGEAV